MSTEYNQRYNTSVGDDELDLGKLFINFLILLKRRRLLLIIFVVMGVALATFLYTTQPPVFKSSMVLNSNLLTAANSESLIQTLDQLVRERNHQELSKKLNISREYAASLREIKVNAIEDEEAIDLTNIYEIEVKILNNDILDSLQAGIIHYLENAPYVKKRIEIKKQNILALINRINIELQELDSLKDKINNNLVSRSQSSNILVMEPVSVYKEAITLYEKELELQRDLVLVDNFQILQGFTVYLRPVSPKLSLIVFGLLGGLFLGFMAIAFLELKSLIKQADHKLEKANY